MAIGKFVIKQIKKNPWIFKSVAAIGISYLGSRTTCHANGAKASATLYSIIATAQANGLDVEKYLTELFSQPAGTIFLPWNE